MVNIRLFVIPALLFSTMFPISHAEADPQAAIKTIDDCPSQTNKNAEIRCLRLRQLSQDAEIAALTDQLAKLRPVAQQSVIQAVTPRQVALPPPGVSLSASYQPAMPQIYLPPIGVTSFTVVPPIWYVRR